MEEMSAKGVVHICRDLSTGRLTLQAASNAMLEPDYGCCASMDPDLVPEVQSTAAAPRMA